MNKIKFTVCAVAVSALLTNGFSAQAQTFNFTTDDYISFPGYPKNTGSGNVDEYGDPKIDSMTVTLGGTNQYLQSVVLNIRPTEKKLKESDVIVRWDSLFINTSYVDLTKATTKDSWDQTWDYFVHTNSTTSHDDGVDRGGTGNINGSIPGEGLYIVKPQFSALKGYTTVTSGGRNGHPDGIKNDFLQEKIADIKGVFGRQQLTNNWWGYTITYNFKTSLSEGIKLENGFTIGYTPWCANDVFLASAPVPEPATMLLFGTGLAGLAGFSRSRKKK